MTSTVVSLSLLNRFSFRCPIMDTDVEMRGCVLLRNRVFMGRRVETRRGCQACIRSSKCPAAEIVRRFSFGTGDMTDHCGSYEPVKGKLPGDILERIRPVLVRESDLMEMGVVSEERDLITSADERIDAQLATAPAHSVKRRKIIASKTPRKNQKRAESVPETAPAPATTDTTNRNKAASTGDLSAAINQ